MPALTPQQRTQLQAWLSEIGELYVDVYRPHSGGSGTGYFVRSVEAVETLISDQTWPELVVTVFRRLQYPLRGVADDALLAQALQQTRDGEWFHFVSLDDYYPSSCSWRGSGSTHAELRQEFREIIGQRVGIGRDPFDGDETWIHSTPSEVMVVRREREAELA
jgi:hypothetical protein